MRRRLVVDSDGGIDDVAALRYLLAQPSVDLVAVTTVHGNVSVEQATTNVLAVMQQAGRTDIPVAPGAATPSTRPRVPRLDSRHGADGLGGVRLPRPTARPVDRAPDELVDDLARRGGAVELLAIGPLTNVARLVRHDPSSLRRIVVMGGRFDAEAEAAEFNLATDPEAAEIVLHQSDVPVLVVPYDVTATLTDSLHDAIAAVALVHPELFASVESAVDIDLAVKPGRTGLVQSGPSGLPAVSVVRDCDRDAVSATLRLDRARG